VLLGFSEDDLMALAARRRTAPPALRAEIDELLHLGRHADQKLYQRARDLGRAAVFPLPDGLHDFVRSLDVRLIETQRLLTQEIESRAVTGGGRRDHVTSRPTIEEYSKVVRERLEHDLSENSRLAQRLDSTFPRRMLEAGESSRVTETEIRGRLRDQNTKRARIEQITPLGLGAPLPLPAGKLSAAQRSVLDLYLEDAEAKLATFASTVQRIDVLEKIVNARLLGKRLQISADEGIVIQRNSDESRIPLTSLSSGEQHEIILIFDLLFNVKPGGLVLIDEPEISLHIAWQQKFIADVLTIARLVGFQFVIATHSPQIIENFWPHAQRLGPTSAPFGHPDE
jgi:excinuclease UvrABC ATPase subunit